MVALGAVAGLAWRAPHRDGAFGAVPWRALLLIVPTVFGVACAGWAWAGAAGGGVRHRPTAGHMPASPPRRPWR
jgi:hypothetical protein